MSTRVKALRDHFTVPHRMLNKSFKMGGGEPNEILLIILPFPEDRSITDKIREKFPNIDVRYHQLSQQKLSFKPEEGLPKGCSFNVPVFPDRCLFFPLLSLS